MLKIENLSYEYPTKDLFEKINFEILPGEHCTLIGSSGTGKSTLLNIILETKDFIYDGTITKDFEFTTGYVSQFSDACKEDNVTVFEFLSEHFVLIDQKIQDICKEMETAEDIEPLLEEYQVLYDQFQAMDGDNYISNIQKLLNQVDLTGQRELSIHLLSSGEFKLLKIMREMLLLPDLLVMDEPDVFLDFQHILNLSNILNEYKKAVFVVTHNRFLLNHCFTKIIHLEDKQVQEFLGNYIDYNFYLLSQKVELQRLASADNEEIERTQKIVNKLRAEATMYFSAAKGKTLHARVKILERLEKRRVKSPFIDVSRPAISFAPLLLEEGTTEVPLLEVKDYSISFDELLLEHVNFSVSNKEKIALIGPNGSGKSSLFKDIIQCDKEHICLREDITTTLFSAEQFEQDTQDKSMADIFFDLGFESNDEILFFLQSYNFEHANLNTLVSQLSGGEKTLVQLAMISLEPSHLLLLDEPTAHMDTYSQLALEEAISSYDGAVLMVTHDFYSIVNCMDYVLYIENKSIRKMSMRKFRKLIYDNHFSKDYLEIETKKTALEQKVNEALAINEFEKAQNYCDELEKLI